MRIATRPAHPPQVAVVADQLHHQALLDLSIQLNPSRAVNHIAAPLNQIVVGHRLIALDPERYGPQHKRTLQRRIRDLRVARFQQCLESAAQRPETKPGSGEKVLPGVNQNG